MLSPDQIAQFHDKGYLLMRGLMQCAELKKLDVGLHVQFVDTLSDTDLARAGKY